jgi:hypothetical protein
MPEIRNLTRQKPTAARIDMGDGDTVSLTFDANAITPAWMDEAQRRATEDADALSLARSLAHVILSWDVTEEGQPFPPTAKNISVLSFHALRALLDAVVTAAVPGSEEGNASNAISSSPDTSSTPTQASPQNGPQPSSLPLPSASPYPT